MKYKFTFFLLFCVALLFAQDKVFQNQVSESSLANEQKLSTGLASTYILTKYYSQPSFNLKSDLEIVLPNNKVIKAQFSKSFLYSNKAESSVYSIVNEPKSELVLSKSGNIITGMYASSTGEKMIFHQTDNNIFAISVVSEANLINQDSKNDFILNESTLGQKVNANICLPATAICPATRIDVLVVYTSAARISWGGSAQSNSFIATAITNFNTALINSGISNVTINLVYSGEIIYAESGNISTDLASFRNNNDAVMDDVHALRTTYGADLCALITSTPTNTCGLGYLNSNPSNYSANSAFTVSLYNCIVSNYTLAHEMGHNMGLNHDWFVSQSTTPCSHHHGYSNQTAITLGTSSTNSQRWRTMMAYNDECEASGINCTRINRWANPDINYNSEPTGVAIGNTNPSNEAFAFARFACVVSQFTPTAGLSTTEISPTDVKDFTLFPNPAKEEINIWIKNDEQYIFKIINTVGQIVLTTDKKTINLSGLSAGEYFVSVYTEKNILVGSKKFIVK
ncbi:T9SS type A sorting domain-containing protein [Chryseobacterium chendengshani]|uniref:M12 family metallo-peptidase n=1 Tax=Chryseobacterium sp. LJ668 TaxID=2864040 RepID=UPI001C692CB5|nr:M12 family metallo-peptidase [Chryseobacterium sp. LJ668]MBW8524503.1 T9SS type A sorting domain-containing protein [Chryseobacterium sp. LJ668]QYK15255.1 T9SS type A sorting domain-containing protein [Chryseobacterium sp. LJ668]